jgi:hypothetical protein
VDVVRYHSHSGKLNVEPLRTVADVRLALEALEGLALHDDEAAHAAEDRIHQGVLLGIAQGAAYPQALAQWALNAAEVSFSRWYA